MDEQWGTHSGEIAEAKVGDSGNIKKKLPPPIDEQKLIKSFHYASI